MEEAAAVRGAAREAVRDVVPEELRADIEGFIAAGSVAPGVLTLLCAGGADERRTAPGIDGDGDDGDRDSRDHDADGNGKGDGDRDRWDHDGDAARQRDPRGEGDGALHGLVERAAGVQLIYDGLRLTRDLAHAEPWANDDSNGVGVGTAHGSPTRAGPSDGTVEKSENLDVLAADVLVARGFYLLARTDAAETAVEVVRSFGRDQTRRRSASDVDAIDRNLEADVLELAAIAGATAVGRDPDGLREIAADLAATCEGSFPDPETLFSETVTERIAGLAADGGRTLNRSG